MKKLISLLALILILSIGANAQLKQIAVVKDTKWTFYDNIHTAISNADPGSDVIIPGGEYLCSYNIEKELHFYGAGHYPDYTGATGKTTLTAALVFNSGSNNSSVSGVEIPKISVVGNVDNIELSRCSITAVLILSHEATNFSCTESVIGAIQAGQLGTYTDYAIFEKNVILGEVTHLNYGTFSNNLFLHTSTNTYLFHTNTNCLLKNNIFALEDHVSLLIQTNSCVFENNIFKRDYTNNFPTGGTNTSINSLWNQDPTILFETYTNVGFSYTNDYHLKTGCPGIGYGTDGTDVGIYGTVNPYKEGAVPIIPLYTNSEIASELDEDGKLHINISVEAQTK